MSEEDRQAVQYLLEWVKTGGLSDWISHFINQGDETKLRQLKEIYDRIKRVFGF